MANEPPFAQPKDELFEVHLWDYVQIVLNRLKLAITILLATIVLTGLYTFTRKPLFKATSRVLIERQTLNLTGMRGADADASPQMDRQLDFMPTQIKLISSRPVLESALVQSGMMDEPDFAGAADPILKLGNLLQVTQIRNSRLVDVSVQRQKPAEASKLVNAIVQSFIENSRQRRLGISNEGLGELEKASEELRAKLDETNRQLNEFLMQNNIVSFEDSKRMVNDRMRGLNEALWRLEPVRLSLQAQVDAARDAMSQGRSVDTLPAVLEAPIITQLTVELSKLSLEYAEMQNRFGENHPQLKSLDMQRDALRSQISILASSILTSLSTQLEQATKEVELLKTSIQEQETAVSRFNQIATEHSLLERNRATVERNFQRISQRIEEISINQMGGQGEQVFVIFPAETPTTKSWPQPLKHLFLGGILGTLLAIGACFFLDYMDTSLKSADEVEDILGCGILGAIPRLQEDTTERSGLDLIAVEDTKGSLAEAFRIMRTSLSFASPGKQIRSLVVTSSLPREGKTLSAINLAITHAIGGKSVLLVDADMRKPRVHESLGLSNKQGLANMLTTSGGDLPIESCIQDTHIEHLSTMTSGGIPPNPAELIDSSRFDEVVKQLETMYDLVIFDSPPGNPVIDAMLVAKHVDGMVIVSRLHTTPSGALEQLSGLVRTSGANLLGAIVNGADQPSKRNLTYYGGYYGYGTYGYGHEDSDDNDTENLATRTKDRVLKTASRLLLPKEPTAADDKEPAPKEEKKPAGTPD